jgi:hypothetical protein
VSDDNTASKNYYRRLAEEMREADTPQARYQAVLDRHWELQREQDEPDDQYFVGGYIEYHSKRRQAFTSPGAIGIGGYGDQARRQISAAALR